jgi:hypothetical protein
VVEELGTDKPTFELGPSDKAILAGINDAAKLLRNLDPSSPPFIERFASPAEISP